MQVQILPWAFPFPMTEQKILVGCPTSFHKGYCLDEYLAAVRNLTYPHVTFILVDNSPDDAYVDLLESKQVTVFKAPYYAESARERIVISRNMLRQYALENDYDYFFSLEQDVIPPVDVIEQLLSCKQPVVSGVYCKEYSLTKEGKEIGKTIMPLLYRRVNDEYVEQLKWKDVEAPAVFPVAISGLGCLLIHRDVLAKVSFRFEPDKEVFDDVWFSDDLRQQQIPLYVNTAVKCKHLTQEMDWKSIQK